jgi:hypothetical protein
MGRRALHRSRVIGIVVVATALAAVGPPDARAGTGGQQIQLTAPSQQSARVCGTNQYGHSVCHVWNTLGTQAVYPLPNWWWKGTVVIQNFAQPNAQASLGSTTCQVPVRQASNWTDCDGFGFASLETPVEPSHPPKFYKFAVPKMGPAYGVVVIDFFISAAKFKSAVPLISGLGDGRGFATNGIPPPDKVRVAFVLDYVAGIGVMRVNPSCATWPAGCGGPNPIKPSGLDPFGWAQRAALNYIFTQTLGPVSAGSPSILWMELAASNGAARPIGAWITGEIDASMILKTQPCGGLEAQFQLKAFPSTEAYQVVKGSVRTLIQKREQGWSPSEATDMHPDLSPLNDPVPGRVQLTPYTVSTPGDCNPPTPIPTPTPTPNPTPTPIPTPPPAPPPTPTSLPIGYWVDVDESGTTTSGSRGGSGSLTATGTGDVNYGYAEECTQTTNGGPFSEGYYPPLVCNHDKRHELGRPFNSPPNGFWFTGNEHCVNAGRPFSGADFTWHVQLPQTGSWHVEAYIPSWTSYGWGNQYILTSADGKFEKYPLIQQGYHGQWVNLFGSHQFTAGQDYTVELTLADGSDSYCHYQMADQMKWVYDGP